MAAQKQYQNPLKKGDTVRIVGDVCQGLIGELKVVDPEQEDECFFGIQLDLIEGWIFFSADEIEKVEDELPFIESTAENHATLGELAYDDMSFDELPF